MFRHDEIRDYKDNIRLDYGYAMTIASAQGLTVDRAFLLVDDRPARETIYPAATRHREGLDIYVNRSPLAFDIADRRPEDQADMPVTDSDVRAYLAERWSRSQPKEAALDYTADGEWRNPREEKRHRPGAGDERGESAEARAAANDNAIVRVAREIRHAVNGWRHGAAVDAFEAERVELLTAWEELRERTREEGEAVALSPAFRETLDRHGALMKQAAMFRSKPQVFERLLAERAGIGGRRNRGTPRTACPGRQVPALGHDESVSCGAARGGSIARGTTRGRPGPDGNDRPTGPRRRNAADPRRSTGPGSSVHRGTRGLLLSGAVGSGIPSTAPRVAGPWSTGQSAPAGLRFDLDGTAELIRRIAEFAGKENLPAEPRRRLQDLVDSYTGHVEAGARVEAWLGDADRPLAALPEHIPPRPGPRRGARHTAPLPRLVATQ